MSEEISQAKKWQRRGLAYPLPEYGRMHTVWYQAHKEQADAVPYARVHVPPVLERQYFAVYV